MAIFRKHIVDIDLHSGSVFRNFVCRAIAEGDASGDQFGVRVLKDGQEVSLSGATVSAFFIRADGATVVIDSSEKDGSTCWVTLPKSCYIEPGSFKLTIKLATGAENICAPIVFDGTVIDVASTPFIDPGSVVPNVDPDHYDAWVALVEAAAEMVELITIEETLITGTRYRIEATKASS